MVVAIFLYSIKYIKERNFKKFIMYMILASTIHVSALICIPLYFIYGLKIRPIKALILLAISIVVKPIVSSFVFNINKIDQI